MNHFANNGKEYLRKKVTTNTQGRSKSQIENNYRITGIVLAAFTVGILMGIVYGIGKEYAIW
jgi:hypothetical protein